MGTGTRFHKGLTVGLMLYSIPEGLKNSGGLKQPTGNTSFMFQKFTCGEQNKEVIERT